MRKCLTSVRALCVGMVAAAAGAAAAQTTTYQYDNLGRLTGVYPAGGASTTYKYDGADNRVQMSVTGSSASAPALNQAPTAMNDQISTPENLAVTYDPRQNDSDPDADQLTVVSVTQPAHGISQVANGGAAVTYTPNAGYSGTDSFNYSVSDGRGGSGSATVSVTVTAAPTQAPVARDDAYSTTQGTPVTFDPRGNDYDPDGDAIKIVSASAASHGDTSVAIDGSSVTYTPSVGYVGGDAFTYTIQDTHGAQTSANVNITVSTSSATSPATLSIADAGSHAEGNSGTTAFSFVVSRTGDTSVTSQADYYVWPTDGAPGHPSTDDFSGALSGTVTFNPGETSKTISILVNGDTTPEPDESFHAALSNARNATLGRDTGDAVILNDDSAAVAAPTLAIAQGQSIPEGNSGLTAFTFPVTRSGDTSGTTYVDYYVWPLDGASGNPDASDFSGATAGTLTFNPGDTVQTVTINVVGDTTVEPDETFHVTLSNPRNGTLAATQADATILNDDTTAAPTTVTLSGDASHAEGQSGTTSFNYTVTRTGDLSGTSLIDWYVWPVDGGPGHPDTADFAGPTAGSVTFNPGESSKTITVSVAGDTTPETDEVFHVTLSNPRGTVLGSTTEVTSTILNDDATATATVSIEDAGSQPEGNVGTTTFNFEVTRTGDTSVETDVDYYLWTPGGSGSADSSDFTGTTAGTVRFAAGETTKTIPISVVGDTTVEPDETFYISLSNARGGTISRTDASGVILNDDSASAPQVSITGAPPAQAEGNSGSTPFTFTLTRSGDTSGTSLVDYYVWPMSGGGGETDSSDFTGTTSGTITFAAGETTKTVTINVVGDTTHEPDEVFHLAISNARGATLGTSDAATTILNDDP